MLGWISKETVHEDTNWINLAPAGLRVKQKMFCEGGDEPLGFS
jgi:hypothetical protein